MPSFLRATKACILLLLVLACAAPRAEATHLLGGDLTYKYLDNKGPSNAPYRYQITLKAYVDGSPGSSFPGGNLGNNATLAIYSATNNGLIQTVSIPSDTATANIVPVIIPIVNGCSISSVDLSYKFFLNTFVTVVNLPFSLKGYRVTFSSYARSCQVVNLALTRGQGGPSCNVSNGNTWTAFIPSPLTPNSSPQFFDNATNYICLSDTVSLANSASDPDGDRLIFSFVKPLDGYFGAQGGGGPGGQPPTTYTPSPSISFDSTKGYSLAQPFGPGGVAEINSSSGFTRYHAPKTGAYVVAFEIKEYRTLSNGKDTLLSTTRREIQLLFRDCLPNNPPVPNNGSPGGPVNTAFSITEGESVTFKVGATDSDTTTASSDSLTISGQADILQGTGGYTGPLASFPTVKGKNQASSTFTWQTTCGVRGTFPVNIKIKDNGCPSKTTAVVYLITVKPFTAPKTLAAGNDSVCGTGLATSYTLNTTAPDNQFKWKIVGGTIQGAGTGKTVNVIWTPTTSQQAGFIRAIQTSPIGGCKDSTTFPITIFPLVPVKVTSAKPVVCQGDTVSLKAKGGFGNIRWTNTGGGPALFISSLTDSLVKVYPKATSTYIATSTNVAGCQVKDSVTLRWVKNVANAGADSAFCSGLRTTVGSDSVAGYAYGWSPVLGVTFPTRSRTSVTLQNGLQKDSVFTFVQTATERASGCLSQDTVQLRVRPLPIVNAGPDTATLCAKSSIQLVGTSSVSSKFVWTLASGKPSISIQVPTDTTSKATVNGTTPGFFTVVHGLVRLTGTNRQTGCVGRDSINIRVNPLPQVTFSPRDSACAGTTLTVGAPFLSGYQYKWSVNGGLSLSDTAAAQPVVSYPVAFGDTATTFVVKVRVQNQYGCSKDSSQTIRRNNLPRVNAGADKAFCSGDTVGIGAANNARYTYLWQNNPGVLGIKSSNPKFTAKNTPPGSPDITIKLGVLGTNQRTTCTATDTVVLRVHSRPVVKAAATDTVFVCNKDSVQVGTASRAGESYNWAWLSTANAPPFRLQTADVPQPFFVSKGGWANNTLSRYTYAFTLTAKTDSTGCTASDTLYVKLNPTPQLYPVVTSDVYPYVDSICSGAKGTITHFNSLPATSFNIHWAATPGLNQADTSSFSPGYQITLPAPGLPILPVRFYDRVTYASTGCADTASVLVKVKSLPVALAGPDLATCSNSAVAVGLPAVPGRTYHWSPAKGVSDTTIAQPSYTQTNPTQRDTTHVLVMQIAYAEGLTCSNTDTLVVTIRPLPIATAGPDVAVCSNGSIAIGSDSVPQRLYAWTPVAGLSNPSSPKPSFTFNNPTQRDSIRQVVLKVTETATPQTCSNQDTVLVTVRYLPIADAGPDVAVCSEGSVQVGSTLVPQRLYAWSPRAGLTDSTMAQPSFTFNNPTQKDSTVALNLLVTETRTPQKCQNVDQVLVTIRPLPIVNAGPDVATCSQVPVQFGLAALPNRTYAWSPKPGISDTSLPQPLFTRKNPTQRDSVVRLVLRATNTATAQLCSNTDTLLVTIHPLPIATAGPDVAVCSDGSIALGADSVPQRLYAWTPAVGLSNVSSPKPSFTFNNPTQRDSIRQVILKVTETATPQTCSNQDTVLVTVRYLPIADAGADVALCSQGSVQVGSTLVPLRLYAWSPKAGLTDSTLAQPSFTFNNPTQKDSSVTLNLLVTETRTPQKCQNIDQVLVTIRPLPIVDAGPDAFTCSQTSVQFGLASVPNRTYAWSPKLGISDTNLPQPFFTRNNPTQRDSIVKVVLRATNTATPQNCSNTDSLVIHILPLPIAAAGPDVAVCSQATIGLGADPVAQRLYAWSPKLGLSDTTSPKPSFTYNNPTQRDSIRLVILKVTETVTPLTCSNQDTVLVTVRYLPIADAGPDVAVCSQGSVLVGSTLVPLRLYAWSPKAGLTDSTLAQPNYTFNNPTQKDSIVALNLLVTETRTPQQCRNTDQVLVTIHPNPIADAGKDTSYCADGQVNIATPSRPGYTYTWQGPAGSTLGTPTQAGTSYTLPNQTQSPITSVVKVLVRFANTGCQAADSLQVTTNPRPLNAVLASSPAVVCPGTQNELYAVANPPTGYTYSWTVSAPGTLTSGQGTPAIRVNWSNNPATNVPISVIATNTFGCTQRTASTETITVNQRLKPATPTPVSGLTTLCLNQAADGYTTVISANSRYTWRYALNANSDTLIGTNLVNIRWTQPGIGKVWVNEIASPPPPAGQCFGQSDTLFITINPSPDTTKSVIGPDSLCQFGSGGFALNGLANSSYKWTINPFGLADTLALSGQGSGSVTSTFGQAGVYTVRVFETTNLGCPGKLREARLEVNPKPVPAPTSPAFVCPGQDVATFNITPGLPNSTINWLPAGGPSVQSGQGTAGIVLAFNGLPLRGLRVVETSNKNCLSDTLAVPFLADTAKVELLSASTKVDDDTRIEVRLRISGNAFQTSPATLRRADGFGTFNDLTTFPPVADGQVVVWEDASPLNTSQRVNQYQITLVNRCGTTLSSAVHKTMVLNATGSDADQSATLNWTPYVGFANLSSYSLTNQLEGAGAFNPLRDVPLVAATVTQVISKTADEAFNQAYRVQALDAKTGEISYSNIAKLTFKNGLQAYNILTPNGDGLNDDVTFANLKLYPVNTLKVFNRWGRSVYETSNYQGGYAPEEAGVYLYLFTAGNTTLKGWFEVVK